RPSTSDCDERFFEQTLDHFRHTPSEDGEETFPQRYFLCDKYWGMVGGDRGRHDESINNAKGPIFFYAGNEADVSLYLGATGLMWENAAAFGAALVFAEHRFYGESLPFGEPYEGREYLSTSQALADYAFLITTLKEELGAQESPVIVFGGSYGGMLAAWLRYKYPHIVHGAIAASAPVLSLDSLHPPADAGSFASVITRAAGPEGGCPESCVTNTRKAWKALFS
ncbi:unnamed protein product, partial [Choristocarpus tenellus]